MIKSRHTLSYCDSCGEMVVCADCGNNCCNGGSGKSFGKNCDCREAYEHQAEYWKDKQSVTFSEVLIMRSRKGQGQYGGTYTKPVPAEAGTARAKEIIAAGYLQTSAKYRMVARVPPGKTAMQALCEADPKWIEQFERIARNQYLRVYGQSQDRLELTREEFAEFKRLGGSMA